MDIILVKKNQPTYTIINDEIIHSKKLTTGAFAVLAFLLSQPENYKYCQKEIIKAFPDLTVYKLNKFKEELIKLKYMS